ASGERGGCGVVSVEVEEQVERRQRDGHEAVPVERSADQFLDEAARVLDLDAVVDQQQQLTQGHAHGDVEVGRGENSVVVDRVAVFGTQTRDLEDPGHEIDGNEVERVHQDDPEEHGEGQRQI